MNDEVRPDLRDLFAGIGIALGATIAVVAVCLAMGWLEQRPSDGDGPSGGLVSGVWTFLAMGLACARWLLLRADPHRRAPARAIVAIGLAILAYPFFTLGFDSALVGIVGNVTIGAALAVGARRAVAQSGLAATLLALPIPWLAYATYLAAVSI
jgi:tryptophan-rich sensory protein